MNYWGRESVHYDEEILDPDSDDGTMVENVETLREAVVGHKIVSARQEGGSLKLTLDNNKVVELYEGGDCCAFTELEYFLQRPDMVDHIITGVGTTEGYTTWHIYADLGDILALKVGWSPGNPFYYGYGFYINVKDMNEDDAV